MAGHVWCHLNNQQLGLLNVISRSIQESEWLNPGSLTSTRSGATLMIASDYGGEHKNSKYQSLSFLVSDPQYAWLWEEIRSGLRETILKDSRRLSFKKLNDTRRRKFLSPFLSASNTIPGLVITFLVDKKIKTFFKENDESKEVCSEIMDKSKWASRSHEKLFRVGHFGSLLIAGLSAPGQNVLWVTDQDAIVSNLEKHREATRVFGHCANQAVHHNMGNFRLATTISDDGSRSLEDFVAIPDLVAGALAEYATELDGQGGFLETGILRNIDKELSLKTRLIIGWLAESHHCLKRMTVVLSASPTGGTQVKISNFLVDKSNLIIG